MTGDLDTFDKASTSILALPWVGLWSLSVSFPGYTHLLKIMGLDERKPGPEVIKLKVILKLKIKHNEWLLADMCPQAANHCDLF